jgi:hypothetical protein
VDGCGREYEKIDKNDECEETEQQTSKYYLIEWNNFKANQ